jgi:hypothetical protein
MDERTINLAKTLSPGGSGSSEYTLSTDQVLGQYRVIHPLGRGGMGEVYGGPRTSDQYLARWRGENSFPV